MTSIRCKLGTLIERQFNTNEKLAYGVTDVRGVSNFKKMMPTKADLSSRDLSKFSIVYPNDFVFNHRTSRNGSKFSITLNTDSKPHIFTEDYVVFRIKDSCKDLLDPIWLYMFFNRPEFDRFVITNSWGSSTEFYNWEDICDLDMIIPDIKTQKKYVSIYQSLVENQILCQKSLNDLKNTCDYYIENIRKTSKFERIGPFIYESEQRNDLGLTVDDVRGITTSKELIPTKASMEGVSLSGYKILPPECIAYVPDTSRRGEKVSLAYNSDNNTYLVSSITTVFKTNPEVLLPSYLMLFFTRSEFDRYARFHSWGSARETFNWEDMCDVEIPIPSTEVQKSISNIYHCYLQRKKINEKLIDLILTICPILIRGSILETEQ